MKNLVNVNNDQNVFRKLFNKVFSNEDENKTQNFLKGEIDKDGKVIFKT